MPPFCGFRLLREFAAIFLQFFPVISVKRKDFRLFLRTFTAVEVPLPYKTYQTYKTYKTHHPPTTKPHEKE